MTIYPAIDILAGKAVRLKQGRLEQATVYGDPLEMAAKWVGKGAQWLHVVDLDGAFEGEPKNIDLLREMAAAVPSAKIQAGGGIRHMSVVEKLLDSGVRRVVLGTAAVRDPEFLKRALKELKNNIAVGIDARAGNVQVSGWTEDSRIGAVGLAQRLQDLGARLVIFTDISRDGLLEGPNVPATKEMLDSTELSVIASGCVSSMADIRVLSELRHARLEGMIIGKALYEGQVELEEALAHAR